MRRERRRRWLRWMRAGAGFAGVLVAASTSLRVMRPAGPVPVTVERSTPSSAAILRARGDARTRSPGCWRCWIVAAGWRWRWHAAAAGACGAGVTAWCAGSGEWPESPLRMARMAPIGGFFAGLDEDFRERAIIESFHFHGGFVGFDIGEDVADFDGVADLFVPFDKGALGHGVREFGHFDVHRHGAVGKCGEDGKTRGEFQSFYGWMWKRKSAGSGWLRRALENQDDRLAQGAMGFMVGIRPMCGLPTEPWALAITQGGLGSGAAAVFFRADRNGRRGRRERGLFW